MLQQREGAILGTNPVTHTWKLYIKMRIYIIRFDVTEAHKYNWAGLAD